MDTKTKRARRKASSEVPLPEDGTSGDVSELEVPSEEGTSVGEELQQARDDPQSVQEIDTHTLFPEVEIEIRTGEYVQVRPWSGNKTAQVFRIIGDTIGRLRRDRSIDWTNIDLHLGTVCFTSFEEVCHIVAVTIDWKPNDVKELPFPVILKLVRTIQEQNLDLVTVKNLVAVVTMGQKYLA